MDLSAVAHLATLEGFSALCQFLMVLASHEIQKIHVFGREGAESSHKIMKH